MTLSESILQTLIYSDHFGFPLTSKELHLRLISSKPCSIERVSRALQLMINKRLIQKTGIYYHLPNHSSFIKQRTLRERTSQPQLARAKQLASQLGLVPGVLAFYLTGSLAVKNSNPADDLDFLVVTKNHRLWTTRLLLTLYCELFGLRRRPHDQHVSGKICLNLYLTPLSYELPHQKQSLYTAYELIQAVPLYDPHNTHKDLLVANAWLKKHLPNFPVPVARRSDLVPLSGTRSDLAGYIEKICYHLQTWYMHKRITSEYVTSDSAFFHPHNPGIAILQKLKALK